MLIQTPFTQLNCQTSSHMCDYTTLVFSRYQIGVIGEWTFEEQVERLVKDAHRLHLFILYPCFSNKSIPELQFEQKVAVRVLTEIHDRILFYFFICCLWESILRLIYYYYGYWHNTMSASTSNNPSMTWPECRMQRAQCQAALEVLQGFPAPSLQQQQPSYMEVVLPAVRTQRPGIQVLHQGPVDTALLIPNGRTAILQQEGVHFHLPYID